MGGDDVHAAAHADEKAGEERDQRGGRPDRAERERAGKAPDHSDIGHVEEDLQYVREHQRDAEANDRGKHRPLCKRNSLLFAHKKKTSESGPTAHSHMVLRRAGRIAPHARGDPVLHFCGFPHFCSIRAFPGVISAPQYTPATRNNKSARTKRMIGRVIFVPEESARPEPR